MPPKRAVEAVKSTEECILQIGKFNNIVTLEGKEEGSLKAKRSLLVRDANRRYDSNFCKAAQTS